MARKFGMGIFLGCILVQGFFGVLFEAQGFLGGGSFLHPFDHPCHLKSGVPSPFPRDKGMGRSHKHVTHVW